MQLCTVVSVAYGVSSRRVLDLIEVYVPFLRKYIFSHQNIALRNCECLPLLGSNELPRVRAIIVVLIYYILHLGQYNEDTFMQKRNEGQG